MTQKIIVQNHPILNLSYNGGYAFRMVANVEKRGNGSGIATVSTKGLEITTNHMGSIVSHLQLGEMDAKRIREIGLAFLSAADKLVVLEEENKKK